MPRWSRKETIFDIWWREGAGHRMLASELRMREHRAPMLKAHADANGYLYQPEDGRLPTPLPVSEFTGCAPARKSNNG